MCAVSVQRTNKAEKQGDRGKESEIAPTGTTRRFLSTTFWLVVRHENSQMEVLLVDCGGEQALPVFMAEGEAGMFVWARRRVRGRLEIGRTPPGNSSPLSTDPAWGRGRVALDPSPETVERSPSVWSA